jgi:hypothetical protein
LLDNQWPYWPLIGRELAAFTAKRNMNENLSNQIELFISVFKGREDVFAVRWEKENKSGYMPAYFYDPYMNRVHKIKGGTFQNYKDKTYLKLTDKEY